MKDPSGPTFIKVQRIHLHPEYQCPKFVNDIALLELKAGIEWTPSVGPACLPYATYSVASTYSASEATAAGWGWMNEHHAIGISTYLTNLQNNNNFLQEIGRMFFRKLTFGL